MYRSILERELEIWESFACKLRDTRDRELYIQMLISAYKYSSSIEAKGESYSTESLLMSLLLDQHKKLLFSIFLNSFYNNIYVIFSFS
jgi:hypothetical protein